MDRQNTNEKKTLKKGRRGWVISAAIVALLGISAGKIVLQNQSSQNQGQCESVTVSYSSSKEKEYTTTDTIRETEKSFLPKVDAKEELSKAFVATKKVGAEDSIKSLDKSYEKLSEITKVEEKLKSQVRTEGEDAVEQVSKLEVANKDNKILEKSANLTEKVKIEKSTSEKGKLVVQSELPSLVVTDDKGISAVQPKLPELVIIEKGTPEVQPALPEAKPEKDKVLDKKEDKKEVESKVKTPIVPENKDQTTGTSTKEEKTLDEKTEKVDVKPTESAPADKGQTSGGISNKVVGETTREEVIKPAIPGTPEVPAQPAENGKPAVEAKPAVPAQPEVKKVVTTRTEVETSVIEPGVQHIPDANLNVGETQVVQEGVAGKTETTYTITIENGVEVSRVATGTQTTPAVDKVIHVGTKTSKEVVRTTKEEVVRTPILPGTEYVPDENLDAGVEKEVEAGQNGEKLEVFTVTLEGGVETGRTLVSSTQKEAKNRVVHVGTKVAKKNIETVTREIHKIEHKVTSNTNPDLPKGEKKVIQAGKDGSYELVTTVVTTPDGTEVSRDEKRENEVPAVDEIVEIGTGENIETSRTSRTVEVNYETEEVKDETLNEGKRVVETKGQKGFYTETTIVYDDGRSSVVKSDEVKPVKEVVRVGTHKVLTENKTRVERKAGENFKIVEVKSDKLFSDQRVVKTKGKNGEIIENYKDYYEDGKLVKSELINTETVPAVNEVVEVGTKDRYTYANEDKVLTAEGEKRVADPELFEGDERVEDAVNGKETYKVKYLNDEYQNRTEVSRELINTVPAKQKVVHYGTKKLMSEVTEEETETISHGSRTENDSNLFEGETRTENGRDGFKRYRKVISVNNKTGERTVKNRELVEIQDAVDTITFNGTKKKRVADPTDVVVPTSDENYDIDGTWKDVKSLGENGLDPNNEDHRSAKYLHDNLSQADKDRVAVDTTDDEDELPRDSGLISVWKASRLSQAELDKLEQIVDNRKLNEHFMELLNEERTRKGLTPATIAADDSELTRVANIRANEMADHGSLRYQGKKEGKHKRPDGSRWSTAYDPEFYKQTNAMTENTAETTSVWDIVSLTNEKALAHYFYTVWKHSPGHYAAMMMGDGYSPANKNVQFRVALGFANHSLTSDNPTNVVAIMEIASMMD
ncbi:G5 domain-containing protein [Streptococcus mitis]|jgi:IgA-specific serine endopeptidase|uniref:G5 domain-containing protein n=1 Tax=Streptococcus mitis TaxID=28037 RepID=UPI0021B7C8BB|nr:G5 domain-containing protein [Streptococcus mitis]MBZ2105419.1 G5 domain-containing protein [Streptococcus mitis]MBZ2108979.1 G5 domain-containing protein [Streptococcus mitis]